MKTRSRVRPLKSLVGDWQVQWWVNERWSCRGHFTTFDKAYQYASIIVPPHGIPYQAPKKKPNPLPEESTKENGSNCSTTQTPIFK